MNPRSQLSRSLQCAHRITSSSTMFNFLLHFSRSSIAHNLIFAAYTFFPIFPNFVSSLPQMEPTPRQVRNHYAQKNQEAHLERALAFKKAANLHCPSNVSLPIIFLCTVCYGWLKSPISSIKQDDYTDLQLSEDKSEDPRESTRSSDIQEEDFDQHQVVLLLGQVRQVKSLLTTSVPPPKKRSHADPVIARPLLPHSWNSAGEMPLPLLKHLKSALWNKLSKSDHAASTQALPLHMSSGDQDVPQSKASADHNVRQHQ